MNDLLKVKIDEMPSSPGCYIYKDKENNVLYVGKAKNLNKRVHQYFDRVYNNKTALLVKQIEDVDHIVTFTEKEALVLEINLIKQYMPPFNVIFKDDKHYPYIAILKDKYPRLVIKRDSKSKNYIHYGPFPDSLACKNIINLLNRLFPLRKCKNIPNASCLYYHMHQCDGPCINKISESKQQEYINQIDKFFKGNVEEITSSLKEKMYEASDNLNFEKAKECKDLLDSIKAITNKQVIEFNDKESRDVLGFYIKEGYLSISILMYRNGYLSATINEIYSSYDDIEDAIISYLMQFYERHDIPKYLIVNDNYNFDILEETLNIKINYVKAATNLNLITLAIKNAKECLENRFTELLSKSEDVFIRLGNMFNKERIVSIAMCDMSHIQGDNAVGVVIYFKNGYAIKNRYRKYIINQANKKDDLASTYEVIYRYFYNLIKDNQDFPDMFIVDGGENQINVAKNAFNNLGIDNVIVAGLVKNDHHKTSGLLDSDLNEFSLNNDDKLFLFLTKMQDEVHRFAITFFKNKKLKSLFESSLDNVKGLGKERQIKLLKTYGSIENIKKLKIDELKQILPENVAINLYNKLNNGE